MQIPDAAGGLPEDVWQVPTAYALAGSALGREPPDLTAENQSRFSPVGLQPRQMPKAEG
jgi:hypothetical protein